MCKTLGLSFVICLALGLSPAAGAVTTGQDKAPSPQRVSLLQTPRDYADFHLRFEFRIVTKHANSGVNIRQPVNPALWLQLEVQVRDDSTPYPNANTGCIYWSKDGASTFKREREDL